MRVRRCARTWGVMWPGTSRSRRGIARDERKSRVVELRFFGGLSIEDGARVLDVSIATANRDWVMAKAWLYRRLKQ